MTSNVRPIPQGYNSITPQITCRDAARAIDFYKKVFGAAEIIRSPAPDGKIMHAEIKIGDSRIMVNDEFPGMTVAPDPRAGHSSSLFLYTADVDSVFDRATTAGGKVDMPVSDMFWGDRFGKFTDPFGHQWGVATHIEDVALEELQRRSAEMAAKMAKAAGKAE